MSKMKKPKSIRPPMPIVRATCGAPNTVVKSPEGDMQFELELCWCVHQMENSLNSGKLSQKVADDTLKNLKVLKGTNAPIIKKRQVMKAAMGDYRAKMKEEEKKMSLASKQIKFTPSTVDTGKKSSFVKKSAVFSCGKDFKFDFKMPNDTNETIVADEITKSADGHEDKKPKTNTQVINNLNAVNLNLVSGSGFKFNFQVDEVNDELNLGELTIKH